MSLIQSLTIDLIAFLKLFPKSLKRDWSVNKFRNESVGLIINTFWWFPFELCYDIFKVMIMNCPWHLFVFLYATMKPSSTSDPTSNKFSISWGTGRMAREGASVSIVPTYSVKYTVYGLLFRKRNRSMKSNC